MKGDFDRNNFVVGVFSGSRRTAIAHGGDLGTRGLDALGASDAIWGVAFLICEGSMVVGRCRIGGLVGVWSVFGRGVFSWRNVYRVCGRRAIRGRSYA